MPRSRSCRWRGCSRSPATGAVPAAGKVIDQTTRRAVHGEKLSSDEKQRWFKHGPRFRAGIEGTISLNNEGTASTDADITVTTPMTAGLDLEL